MPSLAQPILTGWEFTMLKTPVIPRLKEAKTKLNWFAVLYPNPMSSNFRQAYGTIWKWEAIAEKELLKEPSTWQFFAVFQRAARSSIRGEMKCTWSISREEGQKKRRIRYTLKGTHKSHPQSLLKMIFLFPNWDMDGYVSSLEGSTWFLCFLQASAAGTFPISFITFTPIEPIQSLHGRTSLPCDKISKSIKASWIPSQQKLRFVHQNVGSLWSLIMFTTLSSASFLIVFLIHRHHSPDSKKNWKSWPRSWSWSQYEILRENNTTNTGIRNITIIGWISQNFMTYFWRPCHVDILRSSFAQGVL